MQRWTRPCERRQVASSLLLEVGAAHRIEFIGPNLTIVALNDARWYSTCSADEWSAGPSTRLPPPPWSPPRSVWRSATVARTER